MSKFPSVDISYERSMLTEAGLIPAIWVDPSKEDSSIRSQCSFYTPGYFCHFDKTDPQLVRHLKPNCSGIRDGKIMRFSLSRDFMSQKPGKFLTEYFRAKLSAPKIADLAALYRSFSTPAELFFATSPDDIERVYRDGPQSCMKKGAENWTDKINGVRAYAGPDLAVACTTRGPRITARALCWPRKKIYSRIYGDAITLAAMLSTAGFTNAFDNQMSLFHGARLSRLESISFVLASTKTPVYLVPYGDTIKHLNETEDSDGQWLTIVPSPQHDRTRDHNLLGGLSNLRISAKIANPPPPKRQANENLPEIIPATNQNNPQFTFQTAGILQVINP